MATYSVSFVRVEYRRCSVEAPCPRQAIRRAESMVPEGFLADSVITPDDQEPLAILDNCGRCGSRVLIRDGESVVVDRSRGAMLCVACTERAIAEAGM